MSDTIIKMTGGVIRQQKNTILKDVNVDIKSGEFIYLIGKVGSGKSSFLKTLYAELPLEYGTAEVAGFELKRIKKSQISLLRRKCGIVFQDFKLLIDRDVYANLEFVLRATGWKNKKAIRERIETVLDKVGMSDKKDQMPHQLSGGEQQRIVLARALLNAPPIILADEPTGNIDPETSYKLVELLREICDTGKTIVIATHQYDLIEKYPGRVLCCSDGRLYEKCDPAISQAITSEEADNGQTASPETETEVATTGETAACFLAAQPEKINEKITAEETVTVSEVGTTETTETVVVENNKVETTEKPVVNTEETTIHTAESNESTEETTVVTAEVTVSTEETTLITAETFVSESPVEEKAAPSTPINASPASNPGEETEIPGEIPAMIEINPDEEITAENSDITESTESFLGKLSFPEITAFDYEMSEANTSVTTAYRIPTETEDLSAPVEPVSIESETEIESAPEPESKNTDKNPAPEVKTTETEEVRQSAPEEQPEIPKPEDNKPTTPTFDLELID